jgi:hypothetical protein
MAQQYAKISIEYMDYLIDLSDAQAFLSIMSKAVRLTTKHDHHQDKYLTAREIDGVKVSVCIATLEEVNSPLYDKDKRIAPVFADAG